MSRLPLAGRTAVGPEHAIISPCRTAGSPCRTAGSPCRTAGSPCRTAALSGRLHEVIQTQIAGAKTGQRRRAGAGRARQKFLQQRLL